MIQNLKLTGDHIRVNIALPLETVGGLIRVLKDRDPRKWRMKPDAYVGTIEAVGNRCQFARPGMTVVIMRWEWLQFNEDEERIIGRERDILTYRDETGNERPAAGVAVMKTIPLEAHLNLKTELILPGGLWENREKSNLVYGKIVAVSPPEKTADDYYPQLGDMLLMRKWDDYQWKLGEDLLIFQPYHKFMLGIAEESPVKNELPGIPVIPIRNQMSIHDMNISAMASNG